MCALHAGNDLSAKGARSILLLADCPLAVQCPWCRLRRRSAQFEHTVVVTKDGVDLLTKRLPSSPPLWWEA